MRFEGKVAFITGAGGGIGEACARRFLAEGASVVVADHAAAPAERVAAALGDPARTQALGFDVTDAAAVNAAFDAAVGRFGAIDLLVNCAGVASIHPTIGIADEEWRRVHAINLDGTFYASRAFVRAATAAGRGGAIVNLASVAGILAIPDRPAYISSKHAVVGLTREMALEFGAAGIRINAVAPGVIRSPMTAQHFEDPDRAERIRRAHALGRAGETAEVAGAVAFLCSEDAAYITGAVLTVDGGYSAGKAW
jgi:meso-butanediol dehydrogenase/(S,S)-butanediol dehydrogenase/diacetyl reductase